MISWTRLQTIGLWDSLTQLIKY